MTLNASYIGPGNYDNQVTTDRRILEYISGGLSGVAVGTSANLQVAPVAGQHLARVSPGPAFLMGRNDAAQGSYIFVNDAFETIGPLPNPLSQPFIATVIARVVDPQYGAVVGSVGARIDVLSGNPASAPVPISDAAINALGVPGGWTRLCDIRINPGDTGGIPIAQFTDTRTLLPGRAGDPISVTAATRPPGVLGRTIYERDTGLTYTFDGLNYRFHGDVHSFHTAATGKIANGGIISVANGANPALDWINVPALPCNSILEINVAGSAGLETVAVDVGVDINSDTAGLVRVTTDQVLVRAPATLWTAVNRMAQFTIPANFAARWRMNGLVSGGSAYFVVSVMTRRYAV